MPLQATSGAASYDAFGGGVAVVPNYIEEVFATHLYTGNGSTQTINNGIDLAGKGGLVWLKSRSGADTHELTNTIQGISNSLRSNSTNGASSTDLTGFTSSGFTLGYVTGNTNVSGANEVSWTFREQPKFFDVVTYTGTGVDGQVIPHSLGVKPSVIIVKRTDTTSDWQYNDANDNYLILNSTAASAGSNRNGGWIPQYNTTATTLTTQNYSGNASVNASGGTYVAYLFASNAGGFGLTGTDNVISCGSYTGVGSTQQEITLGYEPQWVMIKRTDTADSWIMVDNMRGFFQTADNALEANSSNAEATGVSVSGAMQPTATGFRLFNGNSAVNATGGTYIYIAIRRGPMKVPTDGTSVFAPALGQAGSPSYVTGFPVDFAMSEYRVNGANWTSSRLQGTYGMDTASTSAEASDGSSKWDYMNGHYSGGRTSSFISWAFKRAPGFFDEVCWSGNGVAGRLITHNLAAAPELIIQKVRSEGGGWPVWQTSFGLGNSLSLNASGGSFDTEYFSSSVAPTSTQFKLNDVEPYYTNRSGQSYVAYLFASCPGVSKVGSYTGTATTQQINCGFTAGARFVLIKRTDSTGDWYVWDSARGIVAGNDPYLLLNSTAAEVTSTDYVDTYSAGFELTSTAPAALNASGGTYIFLAIA